MIQTTYECRECGSSNIVKSGHSARYHYKNCVSYQVLYRDLRDYPEEEKEKILQA